MNALKACREARELIAQAQSMRDAYSEDDGYDRHAFAGEAAAAHLAEMDCHLDELERHANDVLVNGDAVAEKALLFARDHFREASELMACAEEAAVLALSSLT